MKPQSQIDGSLGEAMTRLESLRRLRQSQTPEPVQNVQLPLWPDSMRATPNAWLRSALFAAIQGKQRQALKRQLLAAITGVEIRFTGWQLDQSDRDVLDTIVHLSRRQAIGQKESFTARGVLLALGLNTGKADHEWLKDSMARLYSAGIEITVARRFTYFGALLKGARDELTGHYIVELDPKLVSMYASGWTQIEWVERRTLRARRDAVHPGGRQRRDREPILDPARVEGRVADRVHALDLNVAIDQRSYAVIVAYSDRKPELVISHLRSAPSIEPRRRLGRSSNSVIDISFYIALFYLVSYCQERLPGSKRIGNLRD